MNDIEAIRAAHLGGREPAGTCKLCTLLAEVDRLADENKALSTHIDDQFNIITDLTRLGNAMSDAVGSYAHTQAVEDARKAWDDEVGR